MTRDAEKSHGIGERKLTFYGIAPFPFSVARSFSLSPPEIVPKGLDIVPKGLEIMPKGLNRVGKALIF